MKLNTPIIYSLALIQQLHTQFTRKERIHTHNISYDQTSLIYVLYGIILVPKRP